jgi:hypothetical protein
VDPLAEVNPDSDRPDLKRPLLGADDLSDLSSRVRREADVEMDEGRYGGICEVDAMLGMVGYC